MANATKKQRVNDKRYQELMSRFRDAYERMNAKQQAVAQKLFCEVHEIAPSTFRNKMSGVNPIAQTEVEWLERYDPYQNTPVPMAA